MDTKKKSCFFGKEKGDVTFNSSWELKNKTVITHLGFDFWKIWASISSDVQRKGWCSVTLKKAFDLTEHLL